MDKRSQLLLYKNFATPSNGENTADDIENTAEDKINTADSNLQASSSLSQNKDKWISATKARTEHGVSLRFQKNLPHINKKFGKLMKRTYYSAENIQSMKKELENLKVEQDMISNREVVRAFPKYDNNSTKPVTGGIIGTKKIIVDRCTT